MLRTAPSLPLFTGLLTLGSGPARFPAKPPARYRASWQLPGPDFHRQATTSLRTRGNTMHYVTVHLLFCWAHEKGSLQINRICTPRLMNIVKPAADQIGGYPRVG